MVEPHCGSLNFLVKTILMQVMTGPLFCGQMDWQVILW